MLDHFPVDGDRRYMALFPTSLIDINACPPHRSRDCLDSRDSTCFALHSCPLAWRIHCYFTLVLRSNMQNVSDSPPCAPLIRYSGASWFQRPLLFGPRIMYAHEPNDTSSN